MSERWSKRMSEDRILTVEVRELGVPVALFTAEDGRATAELVYPDGSSYRYSDVEKIRSILTKRGFQRTDTIGIRPGVDDAPRGAV